MFKNIKKFVTGSFFVVMAMMLFMTTTAFTAAPSFINSSVWTRKYTADIASKKKTQFRLDRANYNIAPRLAKLIKQMDYKGYDTTGLETALANFQASVASATSYFDKANVALTVHDGFNPNGTVSDQEAAMVTLSVAETNLSQANSILTSAGTALNVAIKQWYRDQGLSVSSMPTGWMP